MTRSLAILLLAPLIAASCWGEDAKPEDKPKDDKPKAEEKPPEPPKPKFEWKDATNDLAGNKWGPGGVTVVAAVPGSEEVIAGVSERWLWTSSNGGQSWAPLGSVTSPKNKPTEILFDPQDAKSFWVTSSLDKPGLFTTTDAGKTFKGVNNVDGAESVSVDFTDAKRKTILLGMGDKEHDVESSNNGGGFFGKVSKFPTTTGYASQVLALDDKTWLVSVPTWDKKQKKEREVGIWRTDDAGKTWAKVHNNGASAPPLVASNGAIYWTFGDAEGILRSNNKGKTWASLGNTAKASAMELPKRWLAAVGDQQLVISTDGGDSWDAAGEKLPFQPTGAVWSEKKHCFYAWHSTSGYEKGALMRLDVPEDLTELASPTVQRDVVAWDGEDKNVGSGWANQNIGTLSAQTGVARQGKTALDWKVSAKTFFSNCGWYWFTYPVKATDGTDASGCKSLVFSIKVVGPHKPTVLKTSIHSLAGDKKTGNSKEIDLIKLMPKVLDEQWHEVVIPLADLADPSLDLKKLCEIDFSVNCATNEFEFDAYVDNIGFAK